MILFSSNLILAAGALSGNAWVMAGGGAGININIALQAPGDTVFIMYIHPRMQRVKAPA